MPSTISVPGKVFLLGEHLVLEGGPAFVAAVEPRFEWIQSLVSPFHPESPAGRLLAQSQLKIGFSGRDPHQGRGGWGGSTAEYLAVAMVCEREREGGEKEFSTDSAYYFWREYRALWEAGREPSGADLMVQALGGVIRFERGRVEQIQGFAGDVSQSFLLISVPDRKVQTHSVIGSSRSLEKARFREPGVLLDLTHTVNDGVLAWRTRNLRQFAQCCTQYAEQLAEIGLEHPGTREDREILSKINGVLGVKGCGALMADVLLVVMDPARSGGVRTQIEGLASMRGWRIESESVRQFPAHGVQWEKE